MKRPLDYHRRGKDPDAKQYYRPAEGLSRMTNEIDTIINGLYRLIPMAKTYNHLSESGKWKYRHCLDSLAHWIDIMRLPYTNSDKACGDQFRSKGKCGKCQYYTPKKTKQVICPKCGTTWEVDAMYNRTFLCPKCKNKNNDYPVYAKKIFTDEDLYKMAWRDGI